MTTLKELTFRVYNTDITSHKVAVFHNAFCKTDEFFFLQK